MRPVSPPMLPLGSLPQSHGTPREQLAKAAQQFEAIFVRQMLAAARKTDFGGDSPLGGSKIDTFRQMQDDRFADLAAERGTFGLAKMIEAQLARQLDPVSAHVTPARPEPAGLEPGAERQRHAMMAERKGAF